MRAQQIGNRAEEEAQSYLAKRGLILRERNYRCKMGEIDLIMSDGEALVFVEVRSRSNPTYGSALESVNYRKQQRLIQAAKHYLQKKRIGERLACRFDVVSIEPGAGNNKIIQWVPNAFYGK